MANFNGNPSGWTVWSCIIFSLGDHIKAKCSRTFRIIPMLCGQYLPDCRPPWPDPVDDLRKSVRNNDNERETLYRDGHQL